MMRPFALAAFFALVGCAAEPPSITELRSRADAADTRAAGVAAERDELKQKLAKAGDELTAYRRGKEPSYLIRLHVRQTHFTLSITQHIKDAAQALDMELPVSKEFYDSVAVGEELKSQFRGASLLLSGSIGSWNVSCSGKRIAQ